MGLEKTVDEHFTEILAEGLTKAQIFDELNKYQPMDRSEALAWRLAELATIEEMLEAGLQNVSVPFTYSLPRALALHWADRANESGSDLAALTAVTDNSVDALITLGRTHLARLPMDDRYGALGSLCAIAEALSCIDPTFQSIEFLGEMMKYPGPGENPRLRCYAMDALNDMAYDLREKLAKRKALGIF